MDPPPAPLCTHHQRLTANAVRQCLSVHEDIVHASIELQRG
jgi:hypothetical protein